MLEHLEPPPKGFVRVPNFKLLTSTWFAKQNSTHSSASHRATTISNYGGQAITVKKRPSTNLLATSPAETARDGAV
jgi:hypothetical protein